MCCSKWTDRWMHAAYLCVCLSECQVKVQNVDHIKWGKSRGSNITSITIASNISINVGSIVMVSWTQRRIDRINIKIKQLIHRLLEHGRKDGRIVRWTKCICGNSKIEWTLLVPVWWHTSILLISSGLLHSRSIPPFLSLFGRSVGRSSGTFFSVALLLWLAVSWGHFSPWSS